MDQELGARWRTPEGQALAEEVLARLMTGRRLDGLPLGEVCGRVDLRALPAPVPRRLKRFEADRWFVEKLGDLVIFRDVTLRGLDLSDASLDSFRFHNCRIENCVLDRARCHDWRMWETGVRDSSLRDTNLRRSVLGPWKAGKGNEYERVILAGADFRDCNWITAVFADCNFSDAELDKVQFLRCGFTRCKFGGLMSETIFDARIFDREKKEPNFAEDVDMTEAELQLVEFREFNLAAVRLPDRPGLRVIRNYPCVQRSALEILQGNPDKNATLLRALLEDRGIGRGYPFGLFNKNDYMLLRGEEMASLAEEVIRQAEYRCSGDTGNSDHGAAPDSAGRSSQARRARTPSWMGSLRRGSRGSSLPDTRRCARLLPLRWMHLSVRLAWPGRRTGGLA